jgi:hypothetical protein
LVDLAGYVSLSAAERELSRAVAEAHHEVSCLLSHPSSVGVRRDAQEVDTAGGVLDDEQHIEPVKQQCVDAEEVRGENTLSLGV